MLGHSGAGTAETLWKDQKVDPVLLKLVHTLGAPEAEVQSHLRYWFQSGLVKIVWEPGVQTSLQTTELTHGGHIDITNMFI